MLALSRKAFLPLCISLAIIGNGTAQQPRIRLEPIAPRGTAFDRLLKAMGEQWSKAPNGGVSLVIYSDGTMGNELEIVRRMRIGQLQAGLLTTDGLAMIDPSVKALQEIPLNWTMCAVTWRRRSRNTWKTAVS